MKVVFFLGFYIVISFSYLFLAKKDKSYLFYYFLPFFMIISFQIPFYDELFSIVGDEVKYSINNVTLYLLFLCFVLISIRRFKKDNILIFLSFLVYLFIPIYQIILGEGIYNPPRFLNVFLVNLSIFLCYILTLNLNPINVNKLMYSLNFVALYNGIISILQILTKKSLVFNDWNSSILYTEGVVDSYRAIGIAGSNNSAGNLGALFFIITFFNFVRCRDKYSLIAALLSLVAIMLSQTRIAMLALVVGAFVFILYNIYDNCLRMKKTTLLSVIFLSVATLIAFIFSFDKIYEILFLNRGNTESARIIQFTMVFEDGISNHFWLGVGVGQWRSYLYYLREYVDLYVHSQYLSIWVEQGFLSLIAFLIINTYPLWYIIKYSKEVYYKLFSLVFFICNFIMCNANPNEMYLLNNVIYFLIIFSIYSNTKKSTRDT